VDIIVARRRCLVVVVIPVNIGAQLIQAFVSLPAKFGVLLVLSLTAVAVCAGGLAARLDTNSFILLPDEILGNGGDRSLIDVAAASLLAFTVGVDGDVRVLFVD
jgi:hypothetical protein